MECCSKLLAAHVSLGFKMKVYIRRGVAIGNCLPAPSKRGINVSIIHPFCLNVNIHVISYTNIFHTWDPGLKVIQICGEFQVQGMWA